jgi:hypothetical protein
MPISGVRIIAALSRACAADEVRGDACARDIPSSVAVRFPFEAFA